MLSKYMALFITLFDGGIFIAGWLLGAMSVPIWHMPELSQGYKNDVIFLLFLLSEVHIPRVVPKSSIDHVELLNDQ